jgi:hypothetical protein
MRLDTTHETEATGVDALFFGAGGLISGFTCWTLGGWCLAPQTGLTIPIPCGMGTAQVNLFPALCFVIAIGAALFLTRLPSRMDQNLTNWIVGAAATLGIYVFIVGLLFLGYFIQLFDLRGDMAWLNYALCGIIGAG